MRVYLVIQMAFSAAAFGCQGQNKALIRSAEPTAQDQSDLAALQIPAIPAELKPALIALRRGDTLQANRLVWKHVDALKEWLSKAVVKGRTTRDDIVCLLGPHLQDLDRPQRDAVVTQQYSLGDSASFTTERLFPNGNASATQVRAGG